MKKKVLALLCVAAAIAFAAPVFASGEKIEKNIIAAQSEAQVPATLTASAASDTGALISKDSVVFASSTILAGKEEGLGAAIAMAPSKGQIESGDREGSMAAAALQEWTIVKKESGAATIQALALALKGSTRSEWEQRAALTGATSASQEAPSFADIVAGSSSVATHIIPGAAFT